MQTQLPDVKPRPFLASMLIWFTPLFCLLDAAVAYVAFGWSPYGTIEHGLLALFLLWLFAVVLLIRPSIHQAAGALWRELLLLCVVSVTGWLVLEVAAHHVEDRIRRGPIFHTRGANIQNVFTPDPTYLPGITDPSRYTTGPRGIRAASTPEDGQVRVLCIGGSTTECLYLDDTETWPALLPEYAGGDFWVGNVGISGFDTQDHLQFVRTSMRLEGIDLLVIQAGINDLWRYLAGEVNTMDYRRFEGNSRPVAAQGAVDYRPWWTRSRLIQLYHTWRQPPPPPEHQEGIGGTEYQIRREKRAAAPVTGELPSLEAGLEAYRQRIHAIIEACRERGIDVLFTTQPVVWRENLPPEDAARCWFGWLPGGRYLTLGALREAMDQYNDVLLETCAEEAAPCVDLSSLNGNPAYFYDDCHFTEQGAVEVAKLAGPVLAEVVRGATQ